MIRRNEIRKWTRMVGLARRKMWPAFYWGSGNTRRGRLSSSSRPRARVNAANAANSGNSGNNAAAANNANSAGKQN